MVMLTSSTFCRRSVARYSRILSISGPYAQSMKQFGELLLPPPPDGMIVHRGAYNPSSMLPVIIFLIIHLGEERQFEAKFLV